MNKKLIIRNLTINNVFSFGKGLIFISFIIYCAFTFRLGDSLALKKILIFLYTSGVILTIMMINYFSGVVVIDKNGIKKTSLFFSHFIKWSNIKSVNVQITTANRFTKTLEKKNYFDESYIGKKEILISDLENQLQQSALTKWKKIIRLPFTENVIEELKNSNQL